MSMFSSFFFIISSIFRSCYPLQHLVYIVCYFSIQTKPFYRLISVDVFRVCSNVRNAPFESFVWTINYTAYISKMCGCLVWNICRVLIQYAFLLFAATSFHRQSTLTEAASNCFECHAASVMAAAMVAAPAALLNHHKQTNSQSIFHGCAKIRRIRYAVYLCAPTIRMNHTEI